MPLLKAALHCHTGEEPKDHIAHSAFEFLDRAQKLRFDVVAFTCHDFFLKNPKIEDYAKKKNILLIPGIEKKIERKHVLILNATKECETIQTFEILKKYKKRHNCLIIAPHPFFPTHRCLKKKLYQYHELFDAVEFSYFYSKIINANKKAIQFAKKYKKLLIGTSDVHLMEYLDSTYTEIQSEKNIPAILEAIKKNKITIKTYPFSTFDLPRIFLKMLINYIRNL